MVGFSNRFGRVVGLSVAMSLAWLASADAGFRISGEGSHLRVEATDARIDDVLTALREKYGLIYHNDAAFEQPITGNYSGSLDQVVKQIMRRYDHAIKSRNGVVELVVTNQVKSTAKPPPLTPPSTPGNVSAVTAALQMQAGQMATLNTPPASAGQSASAGSSSSAVVSSTGVSSTGVLGGGAMSGGAASGAGAPAATSSMAELTQRASSTVRELTQALSRLTP